MTKVTKFSIWVSLLTLLFSSFRLLTMDLLPFFGAFILLGVALVFLVALITSMIYFLKNLKHNLLQAMSPLLITLGTLAIISVVLVFDLERKMNFFINLRAREEVIHLIDTGKLKNEGMVKLPQNYQYLSKENQIEVKREGENLLVRFNVYCHFPGEFEGIIYSAKNQIPKREIFFSEGSSLKYYHYSSKWFWYFHE